jgi:hypothetical protein
MGHRSKFSGITINLGLGCSGEFRNVFGGQAKRGQLI